MTVTKKTFNLAARPLAAAVAAAGAVLLTPQAQAVNVAQDGLGEVLLFPYYTVNNGFDTNINITNTSANTVVFKIRFREAHNSRDARDFNVVLSPYDVWTATVTTTADGNNARLVTNDKSCTSGQLPVLPDGRRGIDFTNFDYTGSNADTGPIALSRTREGHIEVIEMGVQVPLPGTEGLPSPQVAFTADSLGYNAQHVNGVPRNCGAVHTALTSGLQTTQGYVSEPLNVLKGAVSLIKVDEGKAVAVDPTVLANFFNPDASGVDGASPLNLLFSPADQNPQLNQANPPVAELFDDTIGAPVLGVFGARPQDAVSAVLSREVVVNQYSVNPANGAQTDWVISFPTKYFYVDERSNGNSAIGLAPFNAADAFRAPPTSCSAVKVQFRFFDREEAEQVQADPGFSPPPPGAPENAICYETQVVTFNNSSVFGSPLAANVDLTAAGYKSGWMRLQYPDAGALISDNNVTFTGLPTIGFAATTLENGFAGNSTLNYGMGWSHGYVTNIVDNSNL